MLLEDKVAIVSGVGPGLGRATAMALAREGAAVGLAARNEDRVREIADEIVATGGRAMPVATNVVDPEDCERAIARVVDAFGGLDILVNSAFRGDPGMPFESADLDKWRKVFDVNVWGSLQLTQAAVPALKARGAGSVVFVNSMSARKIRPNEGSYAASKGALLVAVRSLATELASYRIRVNSVIPGWIWGPNVQLYVDWQTSERGISEDEAIAEITEAIPLGFIPPQEDIAESIVFFASDMSRVITGQTLDVNGGEFFGS
ncbi:MAG TPA: SDR family oxidoreductase [Acidimicrobiia bacterium]|nr:SDR family oxidoreductase [Acidimicrobiia bacterium]